MNYFLASFPILIVLILMLRFNWNGQKAGPAGLLVGIIVAFFAFGLTWDVWLVSQLKGLLLSLNVLAVLWPALFLYNLVDQNSGVKVIVASLEQVIADRGILIIVLAFAFTGVIEGIAGYGLPMVIVAPMLFVLGVTPITAVIATSIGHAWAVSLGNMGIVFQTLSSVTQIESSTLAPMVGILLSIVCLGCGLGAAVVLGQIHRWKFVILLSVVMGAIQFISAISGLAALGSFFAGIAGILCGVFVSKKNDELPIFKQIPPGLTGVLVAYGMVIILMIVTNLIPWFQTFLSQVLWKWNFPEVVTLTGVTTSAGPGQVFRPLLHPGTLILISTIVSYRFFHTQRRRSNGILKISALLTFRAALPASIGVISMVGLSTLMDHSGMTMLLASGLSQIMGAAFPLVSPLVGMLGAFATGSNNNSNVLFAPMQKQVAAMLSINPVLLVSAQTAGGSIGSMIAPAKIIVATSAIGLKGRDGDVLKFTIPISMIIGLSIGFIIWLWIKLVG